MISYLTENLLKIKELAGFSGVGTVNCACQQASLINTRFCSSNVPCQQAIITFWHTLVDFNKVELILCVSLKFRFSSFHNFLTGKSLNNQYWMFIYKKMKKVYMQNWFHQFNNLQWGIKFPLINISLPNFISFITWDLWKYLVYENISGKDKPHTVVICTEEQREISSVKSTRGFDLSLKLYYECENILLF